MHGTAIDKDQNENKDLINIGKNINKLYIGDESSSYINETCTRRGKRHKDEEKSSKKNKILGFIN